MRYVLLITGCFLFCGCETTKQLDAQHAKVATLITARELAPTSVGDVKVTLSFEHVDGEPLGSMLWGNFAKYRVDPGVRNCGVYIFRQRSKYGSNLFGQAIIKARLLAGRTYRIKGDYKDGLGSYAVVDAESGELASEYVEVQFAVQRPPTTLPILIPVK